MCSRHRIALVRLLELSCWQGLGLGSNNTLASLTVMKARREEGMRRLHSLFALKHSACVECVCVRVLVFVPE